MQFLIQAKPRCLPAPGRGRSPTSPALGTLVSVSPFLYCKKN